jgi:hypothetical protein
VLVAVSVDAERQNHAMGIAAGASENKSLAKRQPTTL